jgi:Lipase (class 3)
MYIFFLSLAYFILVASKKTYNISQSEISVWLSSAAYCDVDKYPTMKIGGPANDFILTDIIYSKKTDILGYIGILHSSTTIYVVYRGSSSLLNWLDDFEIKKVPYDTFSQECIDCKVHYGFYQTALSVRNQTVSSVIKLKNLYPNYSIICTGHSLGAAIAQLISMEFSKIDIKTSIYNFGQPRIGEKNYAMFVNKHIEDLWRFTHNKDTVVHLPLKKELDYYHSCVEIFEDELGSLSICSNTNCEDSNCADKYKLHETNEKDHHKYLKHEMECV